MNTYSDTKNRINPRNILGGIIGGFEEDYETEASIVSNVVKQGVGGFLDAIADLGQDVAGVESKKDTEGAAKFPSTGSLEFNQKPQAQAEKDQKQKAEAARKKAFFQALKEEQLRAQHAKEKMLFEEEINDIAINLPTDQKNELLHYQSSYKDRSVYQRAELRKKLIEQRQRADKQEKAQSIPSPAKQPSAMEGAFEGRSGAQGSGTANLSAQAVG